MTNILRMPREEPEPDSFAAWWSAYPKRVGKPLALSKWTAITTTGLKTRTFDRDSNSYVEIELRATPQELLDGAKRYYDKMLDRNTFRLKDDGKYTCAPAVWLNQGRWEDG